MKGLRADSCIVGKDDIRTKALKRTPIKDIENILQAVFVRVFTLNPTLPLLHQPFYRIRVEEINSLDNRYDYHYSHYKFYNLEYN